MYKVFIYFQNSSFVFTPKHMQSNLFTSSSEGRFFPACSVQGSGNLRDRKGEAILGITLSQRHIHADTMGTMKNTKHTPRARGALEWSGPRVRAAALRQHVSSAAHRPFQGRDSRPMHESKSSGLHIPFMSIPWF